MKVLEKIIEEIRDNAKLGNMHWENIRIEKVEEIIRSHMDDETGTNVGSKSGWIPVGNGLPEKSGWYLVQLSVSIPHEDYADRVVVLYDGEEKVFMCYEKLIVAWQPLPEPYKGEEKKE